MPKKSLPATLIVVIFSIFSITSFSQDRPELGINLEGYEYPFPVEYITLNIQQQTLKMAYMVLEPETPTDLNIVLFHGKNFNSAYWERTAGELINSGYRVIMPDQIGFGKSSKPENFQFSFQILAENTRKLLDSLDVETTSVLGHSMGGMLATRFALMFPERVDKVILENPIGLEDWKLKVPYQTVDDWYKQELARTQEGVENYQRENYYDGNWKPEYNEWVYLITGFLNSPDYPRYAWNQALTYDMIFTQPVLYEFPKIQHETLLIIGQRDRTALGKNLVSDSVKQSMGNYPQLGRETSEAIPNSQLVELEGIGHLPHIEDYNRFMAALLVFLEEE